MKIINPEYHKFVPVGVQNLHAHPFSGEQVKSFKTVNRPNIGTQNATIYGYFKAISRYAK
ncbi:MAG: hypothetical protein LBH22_00825 [Bacteroidales bacterium]|jgi:hypothetical protein|nr:hypothetical protein [Bacteroidales bacterium]